MRMKYVVIDGVTGTNLYLFPETVEHATFADGMRHNGSSVRSAGFATADPLNGPRCFGKSTSLAVSSRPTLDTQLLRRNLGWDD